ncbi:hypothetical protein [Acidipropionibacterium acidipropionici]|uniref:hypothetical protein n=1 Tax=Acidipropionibacterium acidipropionici TaxID=1748 RepID=UPI00110BF9BF|nr:hypothetical protein [Acidipropionibacterium acidipropionici]QCV95659.1 hypothetical protein FEZ30_10695 [Acidipropionibacterium acidipropionici]
MNHQKEAARIIEQVQDYGEVGSESDLNVSLAQAQAILAVADQLRAANLIALWNAKDESNAAAIVDEGQELNWPWGILAAQIAEALGIEQP